MNGGPADGGGPNGPVFDPPLSLPTPPPIEGEDGNHRKRVLWAFGAAAALFGAGILGLSLPSNNGDGVNVKTDDTVGPTTTTQAPSTDRTRSLVAPVFAPFTFSAAGVANTTTVPAGNPNGSLPSVSPKTLAALAGVVARGATDITLTPPAPVTNNPTPVVVPNNPQPGTSAPGTTTGPTSPPTTKPPKPTTTTTAPTTEPPTTTTEPPTTVPDTTTTVPDTTTTVPDTTTTDPTTTVPDTTTIPDTTTTTVAATTTSFEVPTTTEPPTTPTTPAPTEPPTTPTPTDPPTTPPTDPPTVPFI